MFWIILTVTCLGIISAFYLLGYICLNPFFKKIPKTLYLPFGFLMYQTIFWFGSIIGVYQHWPWKKMFLIVSIVFGVVFLFFGSICVWKKIRMMEKSTKSWRKKINLWFILVILLGVIHGIIQIGFWNTDHSLSDNSFYVSLATATQNSPAVLAVNPADGMVQSNVWVNYFIATYELSVTYLSQFTSYSPAATMMLVIPIIASISSAIIFWELFKKFIRRDDYAFLGLFIFYITIYYSFNYRGNINDYHLDEWFTFYFYTGKVLLRYIALPTFIYLFMNIYELFTLHGKKEGKRLVPYIVLVNAMSISFYALSPIGSIYVVSLLGVFYLLLLIVKRQQIKRVFVFTTSGIMAIAGLVISFLTQSNLDQNTTLPSVAKSSFLSVFGVGSEHVNLESYASFLYQKNESVDYQFYRWSHIVFLIILVGAIILGIYYIVRHKKKDGKRLKRCITQLQEQYPLLLPFGLYFPLLFLFLMLSPPVMHIVSTKLYVFTYTRLVGSYIYEIVAIVWIIVLIQTIINGIVCGVTDLRGNKRISLLNSIAVTLAMLLIVDIYILFPERPSIYRQAMDQERVSRLRYKDDYYNGTFNYKLLEQNPEKSDAQAQQIADALKDISGDKIVMGTINQFFGLSHVRIEDSSIKVVKTRFTNYNEQELTDASLLLRYYLSPWDKKFDEYQEEYTIDDVDEALKTFGVEYLIVIKSYKEHDTFGEDIGEQLKERITETRETPDYYIYTLNQE